MSVDLIVTGTEDEVQDLLCEWFDRPYETDSDDHGPFDFRTHASELAG